MRILCSWRRLAWLALGMAVVASRLEAQTVGYSWIVSPSPAAVSDTLTYTINVTNLTLDAFPVFVTNTFPASAQLRGASITLGTGTTFTNANGFSFTVPLGSNTRAQMTVLVRPTQAGFFTNTIVIFVTSLANFTTNVVTQVTNTPSATTQADLAVALTGPPSAVFTNDWMTYGVSVTNLGPGTATNVLLTNSLPPGVGYKTNSLALTRIGTGSNVTFNLGNLAAGAFANLQLSVQPTNAGTWTFLSVISTNNVNDPNSANNVATTNIAIGTFLYGQLIATNCSAMNFDPQISLMTNSIRLTNIGTNVVTGARVIVSGLTNWLYNAVGTNSGKPYVVSSTQLAPNQATNLVLELFVPTRLPITVTNYTAVVTLITLAASNNIQPVLPVITDQTVNEQTLLTVTNTAIEPNPHATTLGYGLVSPPAGMSISTNGIITWTPTQYQSPSTNTITTVVTNNDPSDLVNPQLTATNSFTVIVLEVNTAPGLPVIPAKMVNVQTLLTVTNTATNSNIHATILGYGLVNPPADMSINTNGIITWTPAQNQSPSTNTIITVVTNSDPYDLVNPQLTATNSFTVIVIPLVLTAPLVLENGNFQFVFSTSAGVNYTVQYSTTLIDWISIYSFTSPGGLITVQDPNAVTSPWRFYRVRIDP